MGSQYSNISDQTVEYVTAALTGLCAAGSEFSAEAIASKAVEVGHATAARMREVNDADNGGRGEPAQAAIMLFRHKVTGKLFTLEDVHKYRSEDGRWRWSGTCHDGVGETYPTDDVKLIDWKRHAGPEARRLFIEGAKVRGPINT